MNWSVRHDVTRPSSVRWSLLPESVAHSLAPLDPLAFDPLVLEPLGTDNAADQVGDPGDVVFLAPPGTLGVQRHRQVVGVS